jgi:phospholipid/cholesterol/gamma-HCH transport system substrate-binding protein
MKKDTGNKIKLGIFISLGIAAFIVGIYFIGQRQQLFRSTFHISGVFQDVGGLQEGNNVRLSGINVGTVENISMVSDTSVRVDMLIDESTQKFIKKDAVARIGTEGLMGNRIVIITPGTGGKAEIEDDDTVATVQPINLDELLVSLKNTVDNTCTITSDLSKITGNIKSGKGTIGRLLMDHSLAQNVDSTLTNLKEGSVDLKQGLSGLNTLVGDARIGFAQNFDSTLINLKEGSVNLRQGSEGLRSIIDDARGTFGQNFDSTFVNLKESSAGFKILMDKAKHSWLLWGF